jgi:transcriptional regulator with XRE-family HTH domain
MSALGEAFRTAREARGLTLSDVAEHIHIRSVYLAAIEAEDWASIGAPVYARGFIRSYARFLGMDADDAVARFAERVPGGPASPSAAAAVQAPIPAPAASGDRGGPSVLVIALGLIAVVLVAFVGYEYLQFQSGTPAAAPAVSASATPAPAPVAAAPDATATPDDDVSPQPQPLAEASFGPGGLAVRLIERSWLRVAVDGKVVLEGIYPAGTYRHFTGTRATVRAGNAAGVDLTVGGKHIGTLGAAGDVVERTYAL